MPDEVIQPLAQLFDIFPAQLLIVQQTTHQPGGGGAAEFAHKALGFHLQVFLLCDRWKVFPFLAGLFGAEEPLFLQPA